MKTCVGKHTVERTARRTGEVRGEGEGVRRRRSGEDAVNNENENPPSMRGGKN